MLNSKNLTPPIADKDRSNRNSCTAGGNTKWYSLYGRQFFTFFSKVVIVFIHDLVVILLGTYPN